MALKDWKRDTSSWTKHKDKIINYKRFDEKGPIIRIEPVSSGNRSVYLPHHKTAAWRVTIAYFSSGGHSSVYPTKSFKTKSQALKYAKEYMRKH